MRYVLLQFVFDDGVAFGYAVEPETCDLVMRQFAGGEIPKFLTSDMLKCRAGTAPWVMSTHGLRLVANSGDAPPSGQMQPVQQQSGVTYGPLGNRR